MMNPSHRLSPRVAHYIASRPGYPPAILDLLRNASHLAPSATIADIGSGTGLLAMLFLQQGNPVFGVEPDPDMRAGAAQFLRGYPHYVSVAGSAETTTLPDHSVDFVTAGQAFHWFDLNRAKEEFARILKPDGWVVLVWNIQKAAGTPFLEALQAFWETKRFWRRRSGPKTRAEARAQAYRLSFSLARQELIIPFFGEGGFHEASFANPLVCDFEKLKRRVLSNGPALRPGDAHYDAMLDALAALFQAHQLDGTVTIEHDARLVFGRLPDRNEPSHVF